MGVRGIDLILRQRRMDARGMHRRVILPPTPRERERWHALLLLAQGWTDSYIAEALERVPHTTGRWAAAFVKGGPTALIFEQSGGSPRLGQRAGAPWRGGEVVSADAGAGVAAGEPAGLQPLLQRP